MVSRKSWSVKKAAVKHKDQKATVIWSRPEARQLAERQFNGLYHLVGQRVVRDIGVIRSC